MTSPSRLRLYAERTEGGTMSTEDLMARLDGARLIKYVPNGYLLVWHGGHGVHAYDALGDEVDFRNTGDLRLDDATVAEVEELMAEMAEMTTA
mgnify:CR=1 FL=1